MGDAQKTCKEYFMNIYNINPEEGNAFTMSSSYSVKTGKMNKIKRSYEIQRWQQMKGKETG